MYVTREKLNQGTCAPGRDTDFEIPYTVSTSLKPPLSLLKL